MDSVLNDDMILLHLLSYYPVLPLKLNSLNKLIRTKFDPIRLERLIPSVFHYFRLEEVDSFELVDCNEPQLLWLQAINGFSFHELRDDTQNSMLHRAVASPYCNRSMVALLLECGVPINSKNRNGYTALHEICYSPEISVPALELLLACKANVDAISLNGSTPLMVASRMNQTTVVEHLLKAGADVDDGGSMHWPPLLLACTEGHLETVRILLSYGANPNLHLNHNRTVLHEAVEANQAECVKLLLKAGADCWHADDHGKTPYDIAKEFDYSKCLNLIRNCRKRNQPNKKEPEFLNYHHELAHLESLRISQRGRILSKNMYDDCSSDHCSIAA
jgi:ankyrin repeat protein